MTSVQSAIAQVPRYSKTLIALSSTNSYATSGISTTGATIVGSSYSYPASTDITNILSGAVTIAQGTQMRDMGGKIHIFSNGDLALTLTLVQTLNGMQSEGAHDVRAGGPLGAVPLDYTTAWVVTFSADTVANGNVPVTVARVGGY